MGEKVKAYMDLLRLHFFFVWPVLFCFGLFFGFQMYDGFSFALVLQAVLIGFFGFEAGLILNDIVDANLDKKEIEFKGLTKYWRPFGKRPISQGLISQRNAIALFAVFVAVTSVLIFTLPFPNAIYVFSLMLICYCLEAFYQIKKRHESFPVAQIVGRVDFALFLVAGFLCVGSLSWHVLLLFLFFYPLALAHLGVNDLADVVNDQAKGLNTIPTLYGMKATAYWIVAFTVFHLVVAAFFVTVIGLWALIGFAVSFTLLTLGNAIILKDKDAHSALKALPLFHLSMLIYAITVITNYLIPTFLI